MGKSSFFKGVIKAASEITGLDSSKLGKAFSESTISAAKMGEQAVLRSRAKDAKSIIQMARKNLDNINDPGLRKGIEGVLDNNESRKSMIDIADRISQAEHTIQDETFKNAIKEYADKTSDFGKAIGKNATASDMNKFLGKEGKELGLWTKADGFFFDEKYGKTRIAAAAGTYAGGAMAVRTLSGGSLTTNARGEKDIAGIPLF